MSMQNTTVITTEPSEFARYLASKLTLSQLRSLQQVLYHGEHASCRVSYRLACHDFAFWPAFNLQCELGELHSDACDALEIKIAVARARACGMQS